MKDWYQIDHIDEIDSPALVVYPERIRRNITEVIRMAGGTEKLRPHVKTNKMVEVCRMMLDAGINKFKCATIAEAEMLAIAGAPDVLLAYQPVGPKVRRLLTIIAKYPQTRFSCLIDNEANGRFVAYLAQQADLVMDIFIDLNIGMNRTGIHPENAFMLVQKIFKLSHLHIRGLHGYDGHIHDREIISRQHAANRAFEKVYGVYEKMCSLFEEQLVMVMGGTPTFPVHMHRANCECSPGTFVFWDWGYKEMLKDMSFEFAALLISRVISVIDKNHICIDLGYKSVAAENPLPRVHFLNAPEAIPTAQSEEHLVLKVPDSSAYALGDVFYGVPVHICPTVALYDRTYVVEKNQQPTYWRVMARDRYIPPSDY
ncbi:D-TA family PLP-dependent enzyme [Parabacteroides sp. PF5-9]|uniref:D-TA family PLP-dependent enzyme n=1 Tax=Parabacteroides sp. PF5-9 TaxID=1742404 RepID=UPI0024751983|nr:D-TA family PLP-dependent enzyme [Parabacteroides sp. PF5-9]MDH6358121.1 D-serine deaminase-like pyridoxal phosphate-dependent protein [Parabacteroides sp. PF5-9]